MLPSIFLVLAFLDDYVM